jgi:hypothetical protein
MIQSQHELIVYLSLSFLFKTTYLSRPIVVDSCLFRTPPCQRTGSRMAHASGKQIICTILCLFGGLQMTPTFLDEHNNQYAKWFTKFKVNNTVSPKKYQNSRRLDAKLIMPLSTPNSAPTQIFTRQNHSINMFYLLVKKLIFKYNNINT